MRDRNKSFSEVTPGKNTTKERSISVMERGTNSVFLNEDDLFFQSSEERERFKKLLDHNNSMDPLIDPYKLDSSQIQLEIEREILKKQQLSTKKNLLMVKHKNKNLDQAIQTIKERILKSQERLNLLSKALEIKNINEQYENRGINTIWKESIVSSFGPFKKKINLFDEINGEELDLFFSPNPINSYQGFLYTRLVPVQIVRDFVITVICAIDTARGNVNPKRKKKFIYLHFIFGFI
jgi:hypothetical protein